MTEHLKWITTHKYADKRDGCYIYYVHIPKDKTIFYFIPEEKIVTIGKIYGDSKFNFYAENFDEASQLVLSYLKANNKDLLNTIYIYQ